MIKYDYTLDVFTLEGVDYQLDGFRRWLLSNHSQMCSGHFVKAIKTKGKVVFTYDWQSIYLKAEEYQFINDYIHEINSKSISPVSGSLPPDREGQ